MANQTLLLSVSYEPLKVIHYHRALVLWAQGKADIVESYDQHDVRSVQFTMKRPSVVRLNHMVKTRRRQSVPFTRTGVYTRDNYTCQYCHTVCEPENLTFDHVVPVSQGGVKSWTNIVTACVPCNSKKADRTPEQAGMKLLHKPRRPLVMAPVTKAATWKTPESWYGYLYCGVPS